MDHSASAPLATICCVMPRDDSHTASHASCRVTHNAAHHATHLPPASRVAACDDHSPLLVGPPPWQVAAARKARPAYGVARCVW